MDKFCYKEEDIAINKSLCGLCKNYDGNIRKCTKFDVIPVNVENNTVICKFYVDKYSIEL